MSEPVEVIEEAQDWTEAEWAEAVARLRGEL